MLWGSDSLPVLRAKVFAISGGIKLLCSHPHVVPLPMLIPCCSTLVFPSFLHVREQPWSYGWIVIISPCEVEHFNGWLLNTMCDILHVKNSDSESSTPGSFVCARKSSAHLWRLFPPVVSGSNGCSVLRLSLGIRPNCVRGYEISVLSFLVLEDIKCNRAPDTGEYDD